MSYLIALLLAFLGLDADKTNVQTVDEHTFVVNGTQSQARDGDDQGSDDPNVQIEQQPYAAFYHS